MSRTDGKKLYTMKDIWRQYSDQLLKENPEWWGVWSYCIHNGKIYRKQGTRVTEVISYKLWKKATEMYFKRAADAIIQGEALNIGCNVGKIHAKRVERDFRKERHRMIDWGKSAKYRAFSEEQQKYVWSKLVYFTTDDWCRIAWHKIAVSNDYVYMFKPACSTHSNSGLKIDFAKALMADPLLKYKYFYDPISP